MDLRLWVFSQRLPRVCLCGFLRVCLLPPTCPWFPWCLSPCSRLPICLIFGSPPLHCRVISLPHRSHDYSSHGRDVVDRSQGGCMPSGTNFRVWLGPATLGAYSFPGSSSRTSHRRPQHSSRWGRSNEDADEAKQIHLLFARRMG